MIASHLAQDPATPTATEWLTAFGIGGPVIGLVVWFAWKVYSSREEDRKAETARWAALLAQRDARIEQLEQEDRDKDAVMQNKVLPALIETAAVLNRVNEREQRRRHDDPPPGRGWSG